MNCLCGTPRARIGGTLGPMSRSLGMQTGQRWLPAPTLADRHVHLARADGRGLCGAEVMWARDGHPSTERPRCPECTEAAQP